jgi:hypothetical protein
MPAWLIGAMATAAVALSCFWLGRIYERRRWHRLAVSFDRERRGTEL